jgi:hypothetical protein
MEDNKDVDELYEELRSTLDKESKDEEPSVASDQKPQDESESIDDDESGDVELSEEEISKLSPRAQKRIRSLAEQVKALADTKADDEPSPEVDPDEPAPQSHNFKNVKEFLAAVEDEPSRKLLESFYNVIQGDLSSTLAPIEQQNKTTQFENEFSKYETIEGLDDHKASLLKTYLRNPSVSIKSLISEKVTDLQLNKIKPIESDPSTPRRGKIDTSDLSKEELYDLLEPIE